MPPPSDENYLLGEINERTKQMAKMMEQFATKDEIKPLRAAVYGAFSLVFLGILWLVVSALSGGAPGP